MVIHLDLEQKPLFWGALRVNDSHLRGWRWKWKWNSRKYIGGWKQKYGKEQAPTQENHGKVCKKWIKLPAKRRQGQARHWRLRVLNSRRLMDPTTASLTHVTHPWLHTPQTQIHLYLRLSNPPSPRVHGSPFNYSLTAKTHAHTQHSLSLSLSLSWKHEPRRARMHAPLDPYGDAVHTHTRTQSLPCFHAHHSLLLLSLPACYRGVTFRFPPRVNPLSTCSFLFFFLIPSVPTSQFSTPDIQGPQFHPIYLL